MIRYSNGFGHLIMSIIIALCGLTLILWPTTDAATKAIGISLLLTVSGAWFIPGAAKQVAYQIQKQISPTAETPETSGVDKAQGQ